MRRRLAALVALVLFHSALGWVAPARANDLAPYTIVETSFVSRALDGERERLRAFVPSSCTRRNPCPVLYLLHGFGGDWTYWTDDGRVADFMMEPTPLRMVLVMPDGGAAGFWTDWFNSGAYGPPRYESMFVRELMPFVERTFPVRRGRAWTGIDGASLGGFGSWKLALKYPGRFASVGSISGAVNILVAPGLPLTVEAPVALPWTGDRLPDAPPPPAPDIPGFPFGNPFRTFGDPVTNEWYYRTNNPLDLAPNGMGLAMRQLVFSAEPAAEAPSAGTFGDVGLEGFVLPMNLELDARLTQLGYPHEFELHRGNHSWASRYPFVRQQLEFHAKALNGRSKPPREFTYRTAERRFDAHGWRFEVRREANEFLELELAPRGFTAVGSGDAVVRTPPFFRPCALYEYDYGRGDLTGGGGGAGHAPADRSGRLLLSVDFGQGPPVDHHDALNPVPGRHATTVVRIGAGRGGCSEVRLGRAA